MHRLLIFLAAFACVFSSTPLQQLSSGNHKVTANLYRQISKSSSSDLIFCPLSAEIILSLVAEGAEGDTKTELLQVLGLPSNDQDRRAAFQQLTTSFNQNSSSKLLSANKIYVAPNFQIESGFRSVAETDYNAGIEPISFSEAARAAATINGWVEEHTNNKIRDLLSAKYLDRATKMVLVNTLYLSSNWARSFKPQLTQSGPFYLAAGESKLVDLMHSQDFYRYKYCESLRAKFLELDFEDRRISMTVVLPDDVTGLEALETQLGEVLAVNVSETARVAVTLPKFTIQSSFDLKQALEQIGIRKLFEAAEANLSGISKNGDLFVDFVAQKAWINVTETGIEAAAATAVGISLTSVIIQPPTLTFTADHPFLFYVRGKDSGLILFIGRFML